MNRLILIALSFFAFAGATTATTISTAPKTAFLLRTGQFIAQDSSTSATLYDGTGKVVYRFVSGNVSALALSYDQKRLLIGTSGGTLQLFDVGSGVTVWSRGPTETHLHEVIDASFAPSDRGFAVCDFSDEASVFETASGRQMGSVHFPPHQTHVMSAAISNDCATGVLVDLGRRVFTFDIASRTMKETGLKGVWPIRHSSDGRFFAFRRNKSPVKSELCVVNTDDMSVAALGDFLSIGNIRPTADGDFRITADAGKIPHNVPVGLVCDPNVGQIRQIWKAPELSDIEKGTDFDPKTMLGVSTNYRLVTSLIDLRTNAVRANIDNSANFKPIIVSWTPRRMTGREFFNWLLLRAVIVVGILGSIVILVGRMKSRSRS
jgi:hypothetical protein